MILGSGVSYWEVIEAYDRDGERIGFLLWIDTDAMKGLQEFPCVPPLGTYRRKITLWTVVWNGRRFERKPSGKVFNTSRKVMP